jgi:peroxiredoxin
VKTPWPKWVVPLVLALVLSWLVAKPYAGDSFMRVPTGNRTAPPWRMSMVGGDGVESTNYLGTVVVLNFWATWCPPCLREIPALSAFHSAHTNEGIVVLGVAVDSGDATALSAFKKSMHMSYPVLIANEAALGAFGGGISKPFPAPSMPLPTTYVIGRDGRIAFHFVGGLSRAELEKSVVPLARLP